MVAAVEVDRRRRQVGGVLTGADRVAEGQRVGAGAADIGGGAAVVERQRRRAAGGVDRHHFAHGQGVGDGLAGIEVAARRRFRNRADRRRRGVDDDAGKSLRQAGGAQRIAGEVGDRAGDRRRLQRSGVLTSSHRVAEHQRTGAGAADIGGGAAIVERQRRRAGDRHRLAHVERQRHRLAGIVVARGRRHRRYRRRRGVDLTPRRSPAGRCVLSALPATVLDGAGELTAVTAKRWRCSARRRPCS